MARFINQSSAYAVISMIVMLFLTTTSGDKTAPKPVGKRPNPCQKGIPFLQSEAEKWSFQSQIQKSASDYMKRVEKNAKELMRSRYKYGKNVKIPDNFTDITSKAPSNGGLNGSIHFTDGWASGFPNISLAGETTATAEGCALKFHSEVNFWKRLVFVYEYNILEDCRERKGKVEVSIKDARYSLRSAVDVRTKVVELKDFRKKNISFGDVQVEGLGGNSRLSRAVVSAFSAFARGAVLADLEAAMRTVLEESFKNVSASGLLPKGDYESKHPEPRVEKGGLEICDTDAEEELEGDALPWESVTEIPFIQNIGEMWAFQKQMDSALNQLMEQVSNRTTEYLTERELLTAKLADDKFLMDIKDLTYTVRHAPMSLSDGWFSSLFHFNVSRVRQVEFLDGAVAFAASFHLQEPIQFVHEFKASFLRKDYEGEIRGSVKFVEYSMNFTLDLKTAELTLEDPKLDCVRQILILTVGLESEEEWFSSEVKRNVLRRFEDSILPQIHSVLSRAFHYVASAEKAAALPEWSYRRDFRTDFGLRIGENDEDSVDVCDAERVKKAEERSRRFSALIDGDGIFNDRTPDAEGKYFTHVSGIKNFPLRFTSTKTQSWYFDQDLRLKMNEYMYKLFQTTKGIIRVRDLGRARMPDYKEAANDEFGKELRIEKSWIDGLTSIAVTGVDILEYDQKVITLMTNIQVYKGLKYEGEYQLFGRNKNPNRGNIVARLPAIELSLRIDIDYLGAKKAKLEYMKLECIGEHVLYLSPSSRPDGVEDAVEGHFKDVMVEHLVQIFRRAFEDAIEATKWEEYMPEWDYKRDYISEIISQKNVNRFQTSVDFCNSTDPKPSLKGFYPGEKTVEFSHFLPKIKMPGLRRSFQRQIHVLMADAVNAMWRNMVEHPLKRFNPPKFQDTGIQLKPKDSNEDTPSTSVIYSAIDCQGLTSGSDLDEEDFAYGKDDTLVILYRQTWDSISVTYNVSLYEDPNGEKDYGLAKATARDLQYLLKVRYFVRNSTFSIDEFFLRCLGNLSVTVEGLRPERRWVAGMLEDSVMESFPGSELMETKELLFILYGYAAAGLRKDLYAYSWTYDPELFKIAARKDGAGETRIRACGKGANGGNRTVIHRGDAPFIGSEAEWWSFSKQMKNQVDRFKREVRKVAREFLRDHALQQPLMPDLFQGFTREGESDMVSCNLTDGVNSNMMSMKYADDTVVDVGKDVKITSLITFDDDLKLQYQLEAKSMKEVANGRVRGIMKSLVYKMVVSVNMENKSMNLESFEVKCMNGIEINATIPNRNFRWVKERIPEEFQRDFTSLVVGDIKKLLNMAFKYAVKNAGVAPHVGKWNYGKDYGARGKMAVASEPRDAAARRCSPSSGPKRTSRAEGPARGGRGI